MMYGKIEITGEIEVVTGMHIGGSDSFAAIGAVDSLVTRDVRTNQPMLPGSSLKGKLRSLLAKAYNEQPVKHDADHPRIVRLFGSAQKEHAKVSRLLVSDMLLTEQSIESLRQRNLGFTEVKFENKINRLTAVATPRQIERVVRGSVFGLNLIYTVEQQEEIQEDFETLAEGLKLLHYDYLGGHGTRGYGKVRFHNVMAEPAVGNVGEEIIRKINLILQDAVETEK